MDLGLVGHQAGQHPGEAHRLSTEVGPHQLGAATGRVALVEDEVQHGQDRAQPVGQGGGVRYPVGDLGVADLALGPHQALGHGGLGDQEGPGDLVGLEPAEQPEGEGHLGVGRQGRVAAGEDQPEAVVVHRSHLLGLVSFVQQGGLGVAVAPGGLPPEPVDRLVAGGGHDPGARVGRDPGLGPPGRGHQERLLDRLLGDVDVPEAADQGGGGRAGLLAEHLRQLRRPDRRATGHPAQASGSSWKGRTSTLPLQAALPRAARSRAASRSGTSTTQKPPMSSLVSR